MSAPRNRGIRFRQARPEDLRGCVKVFHRSASDLSRRHDNPPMQIRPQDAEAALAHLQRTDPKGFQVAVKDGRVVAFAATILRGNVHFLSMFWALPSLQSKGVGRRVLTRAFERPRPRASAIRCVYASLDTRAQSLYLKFGMRPRGMFYLVKGKPRRSAPPKRRVELVQVGEPGKTSRRMLSMAARFDRTFRGSRRDADIRWLMALPGARFFAAKAGGRTIGYAVINEHGRVGPAGVTDPTYGPGLAWAVKEKARELGSSMMTAIVPGVNRDALEEFFGCGMRVEFFGAWMSAKPVGTFESYLLAGGMLL